jgi:hypothetical protein
MAENFRCGATYAHEKRRMCAAGELVTRKR